MSNKNEINLENKIMNKVLSGEVKMKPRLYFILGSILSFVGLVGLIIGSVFFTNLTLFLIRKQGPGTGRLIQMFESFPLWIPFLALVFLIWGIVILKKFDFSYKRNPLVIVLALFIAVLLSANIIDSMGLNEIWSKRGPLRKLYMREQQQPLELHQPRYNRY